MRTLSTTLTNAQVALNKPPLWKVVLSRAAASTRAYDRTRIIKISHTETPSGDTCELIFNNSDGALTSLDFEHYQAVISLGYDTGISRSAWVAGSVYAVDDIVIPTAANTNGYQYRCAVAGTVAAITEPTWSTTLGITIADSAVTWEMDGNAGYEYSRRAPLRNRVQEMHSGRGLLTAVLRPEGVFNQLAEDKATAQTTYTSAETATVQALHTAICGTTIAAYSTYTAYTVAYDSTDSIIGTFVPADYFSINVNENRFDKSQELLDLTGCKRRVNNDGQIHVFDPVTSGAVYAYEYKFNVSASHTFWNESVRLRFINPNQEIVQSHPDHSPAYSGTATSATSYALAPKTRTNQMRLTSDAQAASIAAAKIEINELNAERGFVTVPLNVGQELWDYIRVTDSRMGGTTRTGNIQFIQTDVEAHLNGSPLTWQMALSFGKVTQQSLAANMITGEGTTRLSDAQILSLFNGIVDKLERQDEKQNEIIEFLNTWETVAKWHVTDLMVIPVV